MVFNFRSQACCHKDNEITSDNNDETTSDNNDTIDDLGLLVSKSNNGRNIKKERNALYNFDNIKSLTDYINDTHEKNELRNIMKKKESIENEENK